MTVKQLANPYARDPACILKSELVHAASTLTYTRDGVRVSW